MEKSVRINLIPPQLSAEHIKEKIVCIRGHRERIFRVAMEQVENKFVFHNYGQGGAGWTFLFGCVNESIRQFEQVIYHNPSLKNKSITIIGAGCYGLLTAITLSNKGYKVSITAKDTNNLTSDKAAGFFFPRPRKCSSLEERAVFRSMGMESYTTYLQIIANKHPFLKDGAKLLPAYYGLDIDPQFGPYIEEGLIAAPKKVTIDFGNGKMYDAHEYAIVFISSAIMMEQLRKSIHEFAITVNKAEVTCFNDLDDVIIFNCAGLGAKRLARDDRVIPVQGHLLTLKNQPSGLEYMINFKVTMVNDKGHPRDELIYYAPKEEGILGITFLRGEDSLEANHHEFGRLMLRTKNFFGT